MSILTFSCGVFNAIVYVNISIQILHDQIECSQTLLTVYNGATLRKMVAATPGGRYLPVATGNFDLGGIYRSLVATAEKQSMEAETIQRYEEKYQIFLIAAMALLFAAELIRERRA